MGEGSTGWGPNWLRESAEGGGPGRREPGERGAGVAGWGARLGAALTRRADRSMSSRLRAGAGSPMAAAGPLTLRLAHFAAAAAAVAASPPSGDPGRGGAGSTAPAPKAGGGGGGRASGRTDPAAADGRSLSPARLQPEPPAAPAHARSGAVTRARRAPPPAGRRHLRAGAGERAAGARRPRSLAGSPAWKERAHLLGARAHTPSLPFPFLLLLFFWPRLP